MLHLLCVDIRDHQKLQATIAALSPEFAAVDVLINNAGLALGKDPAHVSEITDWEVMVDTNIKGVMTCTHSILKGMVERNRGHIVNIGSIVGTYAHPGTHVYGATKAFVHQFSKNLRADLLGTPIRVTIIAPGVTETEFFHIRAKGDKEKEAKAFEGIKALEAKDIAEAIFWCVHQPPHVNINMLEIMPIVQAGERILRAT